MAFFAPFLQTRHEISVWSIVRLQKTWNESYRLFDCFSCGRNDSDTLNGEKK